VEMASPWPRPSTGFGSSGLAPSSSPASFGSFAWPITPAASHKFSLLLIFSLVFFESAGGSYRRPRKCRRRLGYPLYSPIALHPHQ